MTTATGNWLGRVNAAAGSYSTTFATQKAMFLKLFAGEVLTAFEEQNVMLPVTTVRSINSGKTAQFPALGRTSAEYHTPGEEILGGNIKTNEVTINIDDLLISSVFIDSLEETMNHYDVRGPYAQEIGAALAKRMDQNLLRLVDIGANVSLKPATVTGMEAGSLIDSGGTDLTDGDNVATYIFKCAQELDDNFIIANTVNLALISSSGGPTTDPDAKRQLSAYWSAMAERARKTFPLIVNARSVD